MLGNVFGMDGSETGCGVFLAQMSKDDDKSCGRITFGYMQCYAHRK